MLKAAKILGIVMAFSALASGCGYTLQTSKSPLTEQEGIRKIYVAPLVNNTFSPGVDSVVYNALLKTISVHRRVSLVSRPEDADAVLQGKVTMAEYDAGPETTANALQPTNALGSGDIRQNILIATEYEVVLTCEFVLTRPHPARGQRATVWSSSFSRGKPFAGSNQLGVQGDTSALINESQYERAIGDLADLMIADLHESMLAMF